MARALDPKSGGYEFIPCAAISEEPGRNSTHDGVGCNAPGDNGPGSNNGSLSDIDASQDHAVCANPHIPTNCDRRARTLLLRHNRAQVGAVIMVDKPGAACDKTMLADCYPGSDVEFAAVPDETIIAYENAGAGQADAVIVKVNPCLDPAILSDADLMWPRHLKPGKDCSSADLHPLSSPVKTADASREQSRTSLAEPEGRFVPEV